MSHKAAQVALCHVVAGVTGAEASRAWTGLKFCSAVGTAASPLNVSDVLGHERGLASFRMIVRIQENIGHSFSTMPVSYQAITKGSCYLYYYYSFACKTFRSLFSDAHYLNTFQFFQICGQRTLRKVFWETVVLDKAEILHL